MIRRSVAVFGLLAALALSGCASDDWEGRYQDLHSDMMDMAAERDSTRRDLIESLAEQERLQAENGLGERALAESRLETAEATDRASDAYAENERLRAEQAVLPEPTVKFDPTPVLRKYELLDIDAIINADGDLEIRIPADVTFSSGEASLTKSGKAAIRSIAPELTGEFASCAIQVIGHTDNDPLVRTKPKWLDNRGLGGARANAVTQYLESQFGIAPSRISAISKGSTDPLVPNTSKANKAKNRRVAIVVVMPRDEAMGK